jgi:GNAT superfamily N-acetyltransferase
MVRQALRADITAMQRVRASVRENRLVSMTITDDDVRSAIEDRGRGWVVEVFGTVVGFAVGDVTDGNVWALFVDPDHEGRGYGRQLHDEMVRWLWDQGLDRLWLTTESGTRAERFYLVAGWQPVGRTANGELRMELENPFGRRKKWETNVDRG